ncbi:MAG TPA: bifunctional nuclease family protein [Chitinophagales bacterium]|nr:bifunctional nuclease family protein [Chitinophagales bacterium]
MRKIELEIIALSHSITQSHSYAVVLGEVEGHRRLPIVIGGFEAQSIAVALEKMAPTRPLTHDMTKSICTSFGIDLQEVIINNLDDGIFYAQLICKKGDEVVEIDSRTSDAIALAVRFDAPIYTYEFILDAAGLVVENQGEEVPKPKAASATPTSTATATSGKQVAEGGDLSKRSLSDLKTLLQQYLDKEDYEKAIAVRDEIERRRKSS